jgi:hypothetical protein
MTKQRRFDNEALEGAVFQDCAMARTRFVDVDLSNAHFTNVNMRDAHILDANLSGVVIEDANTAGLTVGGSVGGAVVKDCAMAGTRFVDVDLSNSRFANVNMRDAHIRDANLSGVVIEDADITGLTVNGRDVAALIAAQNSALATGLSAQAPRAFLPTRDFAVSTAFYEALGFARLLDSDVAIFGIGPGAVILMRRYDPVWAENCMMQLMVDDLDAWWTHIAALDLPGRFDVAPPRAPAMQPWGLRVAYLFDPAGVLWHVAQRRAGVAAD